VGASNPRTDANGSVNCRIRMLVKSHANEDPPAERVKPIPIKLVTHAAAAACNAADKLTSDVAVCAILEFFFLMRPGEHTQHSYTDNHPFRLQDASFFCTSAWHNAAAADLQLLQSATHAPLNFATKKMERKMKPQPMAPPIPASFPQSKQSVATRFPLSILEGRPNHSLHAVNISAVKTWKVTFPEH
jgi:hypothetical protein